MSADWSVEKWILGSAARGVAYARKLLGARRQAAEDLVQDVFCRLLARRQHYDLQANGDRLLFASITHACINQRQRAKELLSLDAARGDEDGLVLADLLFAPPESDPQLAAIARESAEQIDAAIAVLSPMQRAAISLRALGTSGADIAEALGVSVSAANVLVHRARNALAEKLGPLVVRNSQVAQA